MSKMYWSYTWRVAFHRVLMAVLAPIILIPLTLIATIRKSERLPILNDILGCEEDGWNGNGVDPDNPRQGWEERGVKGKWIEVKDRDPNKTYQGWWGDYKGLQWSKLNILQEWYWSYRWCAWRNLCWNLRLTDWFGDSIHYEDVTIDKLETDGNEISVEWTTWLGDKRFFRRKKILGIYWDYGWEIHTGVFVESDPLYSRIRDHGYTRGHKYKTLSVPSIRPRFKL